MKKPTLHIPQATAKGYVEVEPGMVFDYSFPYSKLRRGRLQFSQNGICVTPALTATYGQILLYEDYKNYLPPLVIPDPRKSFGCIRTPSDVSPTILATDYKSPHLVMEPQIKQIGSYSPSSACNTKVLDPDGICPTLLNHKGAEPAILTPQRTETAKQLRREGIETFAHRELVPREDGVSNTLTSVLHDNYLLEPNQVIGSNQANAYVGSVEGVAPCVNAAAGMGGGHVPMVLSCAIRGRGENNSQQLEIGQGETANCITSVQKDSMVMEKTNVNYEYRLMPNGNIRAYNPASRNYDKGVTGYHITNPENESETIISAHVPNVLEKLTMYRIRKLTPKECFRLMDVEDTDIEKIEAYPWRSYAEREDALSGLSEKERKRELRKCISKSAKYKLAGNSIVCSCLYHIFRTLFIDNQPENKDKQGEQLSLFD